jgi:plastocyanin
MLLRHWFFSALLMIFVSLASCTYDIFEVPHQHNDCDTLPKKHLIKVQDFVFVPSMLNANLGDTIEWEWISGFHTTTSKPEIPYGAKPWDEMIHENNVSFVYVLEKEGVYDYVCSPHAPDMSGKITVIKRACP